MKSKILWLVILVLVFGGLLMLRKRIRVGESERRKEQPMEQVRKVSPKEVQLKTVETEVKNGELEKELKQVEKELNELDVSGGSGVDEPVVDLDL